MPVVDPSFSCVGSFTGCASETKSFLSEGISDSLSLIENVCSDVAAMGSTDSGTMKLAVLGLD